MTSQAVTNRLDQKTTRRAFILELQEGYSLSPIEAEVLVQRIEQYVDEHYHTDRSEGQIIYHAVAVDEPPGKAVAACRKVPVRLTVVSPEDAQAMEKGAQFLRRFRVQRLVYEALHQGGALVQEDLSRILGISLSTVKRIFAYFCGQGIPLPSRGELQDIGRGSSHKVAVVRRYVQDYSLSEISLQLGKHGLDSMTRYLRHFALVMILHDRQLTVAQMRSVTGLSEGLVQEYLQLYQELDVPEHQRTLRRLKGLAMRPPRGIAASQRQDAVASPSWGSQMEQKGGQP
jgi:AraC-like DNA-binding protein